MAGGEGGRGATGWRGVIRVAGVRWSCGRRLGLCGRGACGIVARGSCCPGPGTGGPLAPNRPLTSSFAHSSIHNSFSLTFTLHSFVTRVVLTHSHCRRSRLAPRARSSQLGMG
eukprot:scaffold33246_cov73-Isochrysis_galbana.AAC.1